MISFEELKNSLTDNKLTIDGKIDSLELYERHHRIFACMLPLDLHGPTLDVACGNALFYKPIKYFKPALLPYSITDLKQRKVVYDDTEEIECHEFECERTLLPVKDGSLGTVLFCDVIEHLLIDPVWTILEFNRVLKEGGHLVISTPNACHIRRIFLILNGQNSATENHIKPTSIYQRHNREWTCNELNTLLLNFGFANCQYSTSSHLLSEMDKGVLKLARELHLTDKEDLEFGPEIFFVAQKEKHITLESNLSLDERWPDWLYSHHANYRRRPKTFPNLIGEDYG